MNTSSSKVTVRILNWPAFGKTTSMSLDRQLVHDEKSVRAYCEKRFGTGKLRQGVDHTYEYNRSAVVPPILLTLFTKLLNKSY